MRLKKHEISRRVSVDQENGGVRGVESFSCFWSVTRKTAPLRDVEWVLWSVYNSLLFFSGGLGRL